MIQDSSQKHFEDLTSTQSKSNKIGLGTLHKDLQEIRQELRGNDSLNTGTVNPLLDLVPANQQFNQDDAEPSIWQQLKSSAIMGIKEALGVRIDPEDDITRTEPEMSNQRIYDEFIQQVKQQQDLLLDATKEQTDIFKKLEETVEKLKLASHEDSKKLLASINKLANELKGTPDTEAKSNIEKIMPLQQARAQATAARTSSIIANPAPAPRSAAIPALLQPAPAPLYDDAGTISSESEGDKVQTGERETDMATILGFLGNLMSGGNSGGILPIGNPFGPKGGPMGPPAPPKTTPKTPLLEKFKKFGKRIGGGVLNAGGMARATGIGSLFYASELGNSDLYSAEDLSRMQPQAGSPDLAALEAEHKQIEKEMYDLVTTPAASEEQKNAADARINELNKAAAENVRRQNEIIKSGPKSVPGPMPATKPDRKVIDQSLQNRDLQSQQQPTAPVIINNQQTVGSNTPPTYIAPSLETRPKESALDRYINRQAVY
jgi:hypothetical protein